MPSQEVLVKKEIKAFLESKGFLMINCASGAIRTQKGNFFRTGEVGLSDLIGLIPDNSGRVVFIEVKQGKNKQSEGQKIFEQKVKNLGGIYFVAYGIEDVIKNLKEINLWQN